jgi:hypothetical protein
MVASTLITVASCLYLESVNRPHAAIRIPREVTQDQWKTGLRFQV